MAQISHEHSQPVLIQGGMGIAISNWRLARAVARRGHLGVVSGTAIDRVIACRLQKGDEGGDVRRAFDAFPDREMADRVYARWHNKEGLSAPGAYKIVPMFGIKPSRNLLELAVMSGFTEVWLAKQGFKGPVGINLLEKIQAPTLPILYGALLAGTDYVLMGAGIPRDVPGHIDKLCRHEECALRLHVENGEDEYLPFDPSVVGDSLSDLARPQFLAIVSSHALAMSLARSGGVDGFVVESSVAGGHNAGPRGWFPASNEDPEYGPRDVPDLGRIAKLGLPFWLAGGRDFATSVSDAQSLGAVGVQVGTAFAFCSDSGMEDSLRRRAIAAALEGTLNTRTEGRGSPTGFPFKTLDLEGTEGGRPASDRVRQACTHGYLRSAYRNEDGSIGWRCASAPEDRYVAKGGDAADCADRRCLCNGLLATAGHAHAMKAGGVELPLVTSGMILDLERFLGENDDYDANAVIDCLGLADEARLNCNSHIK